MLGKMKSLVFCFIVLIGFSSLNCVGDELPQDDKYMTSSDMNNPEALDTDTIYQIIDELLVQDDSTYNTLTDQQKAIVIEEIKDKRIYPTGINGVPKASLPYCTGGYWGAGWQYESIEPRYSTSGLKYQVGPNCYMWAPGDDCGTDYDDYMLSFYFGNHAESLSQLRTMLKYTSTNWWVRLVLIGSLSSRVYEQTSGGGRDNYNIYSCIDDYYYPYLSTFLMRKY
jgi:hypothetical protein